MKIVLTHIVNEIQNGFSIKWFSNAFPFGISNYSNFIKLHAMRKYSKRFRRIALRRYFPFRNSLMNWNWIFAWDLMKNRFSAGVCVCVDHDMFGIWDKIFNSSLSSVTDMPSVCLQKLYFQCEMQNSSKCSIKIKFPHHVTSTLTFA